MFKLIGLALLLSLCGCVTGNESAPFDRNAAGSMDFDTYRIVVDAASRQGHCEKSGGTFAAPAVRGRFGKYFINTTAFEYGPNNCISRAEEFGIETALGGSAPPGFSAFAVIFVDLSPASSVTFQGTGRTITFRSSHFLDLKSADFWLFVYDERSGKLIDSYNLGTPTGDTFTAPSLYQDGFVVPHIGSGQIGNVFQLAYTYSRAANPTSQSLIK